MFFFKRIGTTPEQLPEQLRFFSFFLTFPLWRQNYQNRDRPAQKKQPFLGCLNRVVSVF
jgi:hypothetical protein